MWESVGGSGMDIPGPQQTRAGAGMRSWDDIAYAVREVAWIRVDNKADAEARAPRVVGRAGGKVNKMHIGGRWHMPSQG